ncbi:MAG: hypothetical protein RLZZ397_253 [Pseudomonadota bacterium]|jgi:hypothetical protein
MKKLIFTVFLIVSLPWPHAIAQDYRQLVPLTPEAQATLKQEMIDNLVALHQIMALLGEKKYLEAGELAEMSMGESAMGKNADLPVVARPGPQMPKEMNAIGKDGHRAASEFAQACQSQDLNQIMPKLNLLTMNCMVCHASYRTR